MKLFELFLIEYGLTDVSSGVIYRGYINANTHEVVAQEGRDIDMPHTDLVARNPNKFNVPEEMRKEVPTDNRKYYNWVIDNDMFAGPWQQVAYRNHWVRYSIWGRTNELDIGLSGYTQDLADVLSSAMIISGVKTALYKEKTARFSIDVIVPDSRNIRGSFSDHINGMTSFNGMKRRFAEKYGVKLIERVHYETV